ncbi:putative lipid-binding transport protein (Tim44 family) [Variovorax boronicumulans]|uniref:hypothetical protein n=1 Tax=Variovorax boronicumulans TaxID=436515 RepID=UPI0024743648|nr:hypothetical protein [Variovorax boronicumulans]MDH6170272.1 putative lipid-binding transport protein (Tim44 family) [Variovorax boronicumulans]
MKTLLILACTAIGIFVGYSMGGGFGGGPSIGAAVGGMFTLILMVAGGGIGFAIGAVIAIALCAGKSEPSARQNASDPE